MAGLLTTAQKNAYAGPITDGTKITRTSVLSDGTTDYDISADVITYGSTTFELDGYDNRGRNAPNFPMMDITVKNTNGKYSPYYAGSYWPTGDIGNWKLTFTVTETLSDSAGHDLCIVEFVLVEATPTGDTAKLVFAHPTWYLWRKEWIREDSHTVDINGNSTSL